MRVHVKFQDKCLVIPCKDSKESVKWLISEAVKRFHSLGYLITENEQSCLYLPNEGGMLWIDDAIEDVLCNNSFVELKSELKLFVLYILCS